MSTSVALLRGINVSKSTQIAMADLKATFEDLGCSGVRTHLRSGNVVFERARNALSAQDLSAAIQQRSGVLCSVLVLDATELQEIVAADPFGESAPDPAKYLVTVLSGTPSAEIVAEAEGHAPTSETRVVGRAAYTWCPQGVQAVTGDAKFWEKRGLVATSRNWRTIKRLADMSAP